MAQERVVFKEEWRVKSSGALLRRWMACDMEVTLEGHGFVSFSVTFKSFPVSSAPPRSCSEGQQSEM